MTLTPALDAVVTHIVQDTRAAARSLVGLTHAIGEFVRSIPTNAWAMCAFVAAASILVTVVTAYLWPREAPVAPVRDSVDAVGVRRLAQNGVPPAEIARRTGLSHDAVATILRAGTLSRGERTGRRRQSRPRTA